MAAAFDPTIGRKTWRSLEAYHGAIYFAPEAAEAYAAVGVDDRMTGYFASRSAAMGAVTADVVIATFYNFNHDLIRRSMADVWNVVTPTDLVAARFRAADAMIRRLVDAADLDSAEMRRAATIARRAAEAACEQPHGRPLFAANAGLDWPDEPHMVLWHAQTLLREFRGDGHLAALVAADLDGCEALVTHGAAGDVPASILKASRQRTDDEWAAATESLQARGWLDADGAFTEAGRQARADIETTTDRMAAAPYAAIGDARCAELRDLVRPWSAAMASVFGR
ncbi:SCO6745 family protein [Ilumatobacter coccineus]|uniref:SalK n=1 Tax=Ilumatobacter coccineus (strain NBRC 103263 / KCTC 29153 / YM16-304) TaxID=1313172 RepID=A0A6C7EB70_ILUCY|nr:hypothetical protein [Ilumatobacter coccineus]BAN02449.1 hypothetical protein YM304_21350 [Ilumatobacter coccineus YM16-304]